jgi:hypothetical protein
MHASVMRIPTCRLLPEDARSMLQRAACTPNPPDDPLARQKAIEEANRRVRRMYPEYFQQEL